METDSIGPLVEVGDVRQIVSRHFDPWPPAFVQRTASLPLVGEKIVVQEICTSVGTAGLGLFVVYFLDQRGQRWVAEHDNFFAATELL